MKDWFFFNLRFIKFFCGCLWRDIMGNSTSFFELLQWYLGRFLSHIADLGDVELFSNPVYPNSTLQWNKLSRWTCCIDLQVWDDNLLTSCFLVCQQLARAVFSLFSVLLWSFRDSLKPGFAACWVLSKRVFMFFFSSAGLSCWWDHQLGPLELSHSAT